VSLLDVIDDFATAVSYAVSRPAVGSLTLGRYTPGSSSNFNIVAIIVPLSGRDLKVLPEGRRAEDTRKVITATQLKVGDLITIDSQTWEVFHLDAPWIAFGDTHYNAFAALQVKTP
jgi:hypothetical protein